MNMYPQQYPQQPGQPMYQAYGVQPQQMPPQQQYYQQPQQQQMPQQGMVMANPQLNEMQQALMNYVAQQANQTQVGGFIYTRGAQNQWRDAESTMLVRVGAALLNHIMRSTPGIQPQQAMNMAVQQAYDIAVISTLYTMPQMVQQVPPQVLQGLLQNMPMLQQVINQALPAAGIPPLVLTIPGYQVMTQQQANFQPVAPNMVMPGYQQQPSMQQQYAMPMAPTMQQQQQPGQQSGSAHNLGYSNARAVIPPAGGENHLGMKPVDMGTLNVGSNRGRQQEDANLGITARKVDYTHVPTLEPLIPQPAPVQQPLQQARTQWTPPPQWNNGVIESHATPTLAQAIHNQLQEPAQVPSSDINFDSIMALDTSEEAELFNAPASEHSVMPSMTELFGNTFGASKGFTPDPMSQAMAGAYSAPVDNSTYSHHLPNDQVVDLTAGQVTVSAPQQMEARPLSEDGLPDGWLFTEKHYDAPSSEFYHILMKAKRHKTCPWPIGYDRRFCTRLYRYMENGSIEQKIVGVPMDRLKHDITLLDTPVPTEQIRQAEIADFGPLSVMNVGEAVKIIKDPETTPEILDEKLGENSIYLVDKPVYALSRQEAVLLTAVKVKPLMDNLKKGTHGFETQIREISLITSHPEIEAYLNNEYINKLTIDSTASDLMDLAETIRTIRTEGLMSERQLHKVTEYMRDTLNTMLHADYGYSDELELEEGNPFEDELVQLIMFMNKSEEDLDVLNRIHKNWANVRSRLCTLLTGNALRTAQQQLARRYDLPEEDREAMLAQMESAVLLQTAYSVTTMARTTKQMRANDNHPAFVTMASERPYLHQLMTDIKKRGKSSGAVLSKHFIIASDGVELAFTQAGLGNGNTFPTFYVHY